MAILATTYIMISNTGNRLTRYAYDRIRSQSSFLLYGETVFLDMASATKVGSPLVVAPAAATAEYVLIQAVLCLNSTQQQPELGNKTKTILVEVIRKIFLFL